MLEIACKDCIIEVSPLMFVFVAMEELLKFTHVDALRAVIVAQENFFEGHAYCTIEALFWVKLTLFGVIVTELFFNPTKCIDDQFKLLIV
jgi:hypothetical protein